MSGHEPDHPSYGEPDHSPLVPAKTRVFGFLSDQHESLKAKRSLKLNSLKSHLPSLLTNDIIEYVYQYINSFDPPLEIERISLAHNLLEDLPLNFKLLAKHLRYLNLHNNNLLDVPIEVYDLTTLEYLDLSHNKLSHLSRSRLPHLAGLKLISLKNNKFKYLTPALGDLPNLELIEVNENPLVLPPLDLVTKLQKQLADLDWVRELKMYLINNTGLIESKIYGQQQSQPSHQSQYSHSSSQHSHSSSHSHISSQLSSFPKSAPPQIARSKSISETKTKASKAARRMGLIIKKPDDSNEPELNGPPTSNSAYAFPSADFPLPLNVPNSSSSMDSSFNLISPPSAATAPGSAADSRSSSPPMTPTAPAPGPAPAPSASIPARPSSRSRSNTLIEIDRMLENNDHVDTEHKLGAYFRRLSVLTESPMDEAITTREEKRSRSHSQSQPQIPPQLDLNASSRNGSVSQLKHAASNSVSETEESDIGSSSSHQRSVSTTKTPPANKPSTLNLEVSPSKVAKKTGPTRYDAEPSLIIGVSRKILFAFSELHSSVRRFSGFCVDKKVTIKMVSFLYTAKSNIDSLVENLELMEENSNNTDKIMESLHTCIASFKSIMNLLSENFSKFVAKIDVCFIRMLYLTVFGSFNEIFNAYKLLVPNTPVKSPGNMDLKKANLSINTNINHENNEEVDGKLYDSIEVATAKARDVFSELTKAISKSAIASANANSNKTDETPEGAQEISPQVATKVKELTNVCVSSMDIIKRLKTKLITIRNNPSFTTKKLFWDDINYFLKAIIQTFSSVKGIMKDLPILNDIRSSMATLTKSTKDVTILLEASSYKTMANDYNSSQTSNYAPALTSIPSVSNIFTPLSAHPNSGSYTQLPQQSQLPHSQFLSQSQVNLSQLQSLQPPVRTPLVAALGPAAQAILPQHTDVNSPSQFHQPFINQLQATSPLPSPGTVGSKPGTPQSSGQYYANNGMNPFDGLIMANRAKLGQLED